MNDRVLEQFASINQAPITENYRLSISAAKFRPGMLVLGGMAFGAGPLALAMLLLSLV